MGGGPPVPQNKSWFKQIGTLAHISAGDDGEIWGLTSDDGIRRWNDGEWQPVEGALRQLSVGDQKNLWGVAADETVYRWIGGWKLVPGRLRWVSAASDGTVVGVNSNDDIFRYLGRGGWEQLPGKLLQISAASRKVMYGISRSGDVFRWNGGGWDRIDGKLSQISARVPFETGSGEVSTRAWGVVLPAGSLFELTAGLGMTPTWVPMPGQLKQLSVASTLVVGVTTAGEVYSWGFAFPAGNRPLVMRQDRWRWCRKCQGLFFSGHPTAGRCPARTELQIATAEVHHDGAGSGEYAVATSTGAPGQAGWKWCRKCEGMFFSGAASKCAAGGTHDGSRSGDYTILHKDPAAAGQDGWRWCSKCSGLFYGGGGTTRCPAGGAHDGATSGPYKVLIVD